MSTTATQVRVLLTSGRAVELTGDEARELWAALCKLYGGPDVTKEFIPYPVPYYPTLPCPSMDPWHPIITCHADGSVSVASQSTTQTGKGE